MDNGLFIGILIGMNVGVLLSCVVFIAGGIWALKADRNNLRTTQVKDSIKRLKS